MTEPRRSHGGLSAVWLGATLVLVALLPLARPPEAAERELPNVLVVTVDALRVDRLSGYGYPRPTSPEVDRLLSGGVRFAEARTVEPLTSPSLSSMVTSLYPHEHGGTRNGLRMRPGLPSLPRQLAAHGWQTAAFVGNWTLKNRLSGLGEHFEDYEAVLNTKRWFGLFKGEATAEDLTDRALAWLDTHGGRRRPFFLWVHYVEPHAPYHLHEEYVDKLGIHLHKGDASRSDRYDTEIAFADHHIGRLLARVEDDPRLAPRTLVIFAADHGESLGEHNYWGHGRNLYEPCLHIPLAFYWPGHLQPKVIGAPAVLIDVAPTVAHLLGLEPLSTYRGQDWTDVLLNGAVPKPRETYFQAHKGAVLSHKEANDARRWGLLEVGVIHGEEKEIFELGKHDVKLYDLADDPGESKNLAAPKSRPSRDLEGWLAKVENGLNAASNAPPPALDPEALEKLKALGYTD